MMIDEIEVLNDYAGNDSRYDHQFMASLNHLKHSQEIRFLCASHGWLKSTHFSDNIELIELTQLNLPVINLQKKLVFASFSFFLAEYPKAENLWVIKRV
jgi:hypothetical protein